MIYTITGNNFSGRSAYLNSLRNAVSTISILKVIPNRFLSGLSTTVRQELELHANIRTVNITNLIESLQFSETFGKNPFELSGGQQAICAILNMILLDHQINILDCSLEQLDNDTRKIFISYFNDTFKRDLYIADNRLEEFVNNLNHFSNQTLRMTKKELVLAPFVNPNVFKQEAFTLTLENISFNYKTEEVLKGLSGAFTSGNIYLLEGKNGAGKSTLAKLLVGVIKPLGGKILLNGNKFEPFATPGKVVGYSFQNPKEQIFANSVSKEVASGLESTYDNNKILEEVGFSFGFSKLGNSNPFELPFVLQKRLAIASSVAMNRPFLILDEPTIGQDNYNSLMLVKLIKQLAYQGICVILISHSSWFKQQFEYKKVELKDGKLYF